MKPNGTQGTYRAVSQNPQTDENEEPKKASSHESVIENGQNVKTSPAHSKEFQDDTGEDEKKPMSPLRKFCFVLSLLQCALFIIAFGWLIPCKIPRHSSKSHSQNWALNYYGENFVTSLAVTGIDHKPVAVVLGFSSLSNSSIYGIRAVNAFDGSSMWETIMPNKPLDIVCNSLDIDSDSMPDCLVTDDSGKMLGVSGSDGQIIWYMHTHHGNLNTQSVSKPVIGSSCHGENDVNIYVAVKDRDGMYFLVTVSGLSGRIEEVYKLTECVAMPENMMWRNSKVEHDEIDTHQELVMSCANKAGNAIIYSINADEFCKNSTFQVFHEMFFKLAIINAAKFPLRMELLNTDQGDNLAVLIDDSKIKIYNEENVEQEQFSVEGEITIKDFVTGHFTNSSLANIIVLTSGDSQSPNTLLLLDNSHSNVLRSVPIENGTATSISVVHNAFNSLDTVVVKVISERRNYDNNATDAKSSNIKQFEESYLILECFDTGSFRTVSEDLTSANCHDADCTSNIFQMSNYAVLADVDKDEKEELLYFTRKAFPSTLVQSITLKLTRLSDPLAKTCTSCHC